jgi:hypothetical protein
MWWLKQSQLPKLCVCVLVSNCMAPEPEGSTPYSQQSATGPYHEPTESTTHPQLVSQRSILIPSSHLRLGLPSGLLPSGFLD